MRAKNGDSLQQWCPGNFPNAEVTFRPSAVANTLAEHDSTDRLIERKREGKKERECWGEGGKDRRGEETGGLWEVEIYLT